MLGTCSLVGQALQHGPGNCFFLIAFRTYTYTYGQSNVHAVAWAANGRRIYISMDVRRNEHLPKLKSENREDPVMIHGWPT